MNCDARNVTTAEDPESLGKLETDLSAHLLEERKASAREGNGGFSTKCCCYSLIRILQTCLCGRATQNVSTATCFYRSSIILGFVHPATLRYLSCVSYLPPPANDQPAESYDDSKT